MAADPPPERPMPWRCFHCDDVFTDRAEAKEHFGDYRDDSPLCLIKGQDGGLGARVRELEAELMDAYKQRNEYENDARLYHELRSDVDRRTNGHGLFMHLDYLEGEKLVLQEKLEAAEALRRAAGDARPQPVAVRCYWCDEVLGEFTKPRDPAVRAVITLHVATCPSREAVLAAAAAVSGVAGDDPARSAEAPSS